MRKAVAEIPKDAPGYLWMCDSEFKRQAFDGFANDFLVPQYCIPDQFVRLEIVQTHPLGPILDLGDGIQDVAQVELGITRPG